MLKRKLLNVGLSLIGPVALIILLSMPIGPLAGGLGILQPWGGVFDTGRGLNEPVAQEIRLDGIENDIHILIDHYGVPHIYAASAADAYFGLGYMHAKDRLFQMVIQKHLAAGRVSEIVGAYANSSDKIYRTIGLHRTAQKTRDWYLEHEATMPEAAYALELMNGQVRGINAFMNSMTSETQPIEFKLLGIEPEPWTLQDMFLGASFITWSLTGDFDDLTRLWLKENIQNDSMYEELYPDLMPYASYVVSEQTNLDLEDYPNAPGGYPATPQLSYSTEAGPAEIEQHKLEALLATLLPV
ncbi:hypothetical protein EU546_04895, partial [Candidatus Thorarchaeota archaeon]